MTFLQGRFFISLLVAASLLMVSLPTKGSAQSAIEKLFGVDEVRTQELTPYWSEGLHTLLEIFCTSLRCEADRSDDDTHYIFDLADVELPFSEFGGESALVVQIESIRASISKDGLRDFNGFPENADITISGITLNDEGILEIVAEIFEDDPRLQRLLAREIAKESLSFTTSLRRGEGDYTLDFALKLLSGDQIGGSLTALSTSPILAYLVKDVVSGADLSDIEDQSVRGALLYDSIAWSRVFNVPLRKASVQITEVSLLDKVFGPFLIEEKSNGEREFWGKVKIFSNAVAEILSKSDRVRGTKNDLSGITDFYSNWRSKNGVLTVSIEDANATALLAEIDTTVFNPNSDNICGLQAVLGPIVLTGIGVTLPYVDEFKEFFDDEALLELVGNEQFISDMSEGVDRLIGEVMADLGCSNGVLSLSYISGK